MKTSKSNGFTLIELMVVISIIALLSSVVLASIKSAREKADDVKVVSELKSLQTALELYRSQVGNYPQVNLDEDKDEECSTDRCLGGFNDVMKLLLVNNKLISKVPESKGYPNNCIDGDCDNGNMYFYLSTVEYLDTGDPNFYYMCGDKKVSGYILGYITRKKLNLPEFRTYYYYDVEGVAEISTGFTDSTSGEVKQYCVTI